MLAEQGGKILLVLNFLGEALTAGELVDHAGCVGNGDDVVEMDDFRHILVGCCLSHHGDGLGNRDGLTDTGGLNDNVVILSSSGKVGQLLGQILAQGAADAAIGQRNKAVVRHVDGAALCNEACVNIDLADVVDDDRNLVVAGLGEDLVQQCGLARTEISGEEGHFAGFIIHFHSDSSLKNSR